jgi:hypothetical protein
MSRHNVSRVWLECAWKSAGGNGVKGFESFNAEKSAEVGCERQCRIRDARASVRPTRPDGDRDADVVRWFCQHALLAAMTVRTIAKPRVGLAAAVALGALVGPTQVAARAIEMLISRYHHPLWTMHAPLYPWLYSGMRATPPSWGGSRCQASLRKLPHRRSVRRSWNDLAPA